MKNLLRLGLSFVLCAVGLWAQPPRTFDWVRASDETVQLDPSDFHSGRVYRPGAQGGNMHVLIHAKRPVTLAMAWANEWNDALLHPETRGNLEYRCLREHVVDTTYECHLPSDRPMVLVIHDERTPDRAILQGIGVLVGRVGARQLVSLNEVQITYHSWQCVQNCVQPEYQWFRVVKEKYDLTPSPKLYSVVTPDYDGQRMWMKVKAGAPITVAVLPSKLADQVYDKPGTLADALSQTACKQRGVQTMEFECKINRGDGPQSLIVLQESPVRSHKKAEVEFQTLKCTANCELIPSESADSQ
ncbi:MAG: hypothetical protein LAO56_14525 [Acidobacteriia bacterium]|nr:hypothetical protein [Terriglobia bacterium]